MTLPTVLHDREADADWLAGYLDRLAAAPRQSRHGCARTGLHALLRRHGEPHKHLKAVRVTGSKGKGSTALIMEAALVRAGLRVGVFTSPHLQRWNERIRLDSRDVSPAELAGVLRALAPDVAALRADSGCQGPDFFEVCLAAALILFVRVRTDVVVLESGIGARGDATAVVSPILSLITTVEREHADLIGPRLVDVAWEKAGVIHPYAPAIAGRMPARALSVIRDEAGARCSPLSVLGVDFRIRRGGGSGRRALHYQDGRGDLALPVGESLFWLFDSVGLAVAALRRLPGLRVEDADIREALRTLCLHGRLETFPGLPGLVADGAHTRASSALLARMLVRRSANAGCLVLSCSHGHDPRVLSPRLWHWPGRVIATRADAWRALEPRAVAHALARCYAGTVHLEPDPQRALRQAMDSVRPGALVCATGSVYMAGQARTFAESAGNPVQAP